MSYCFVLHQILKFLLKDFAQIFLHTFQLGQYFHLLPNVCHKKYNWHIIVVERISIPVCMVLDQDTW